MDLPGLRTLEEECFAVSIRAATLPAMRKTWPIFMLVAALVIAACGLARLRFDTDPLSMLPGHLPEVKGLKARHAAFARDDEAILLLETSGETSAEDAARSLAAALEKAGVVRRARWQPRWADDPAGLAELIAYLWLNGDPRETAALAAKLSPEKSSATFNEAVEHAASALEGEDLAIAARDPFGFLSHPAIVDELANAGDGGGFASADRTAHIVFLDAPRDIHGYRDAGNWLDEVRKAIAHWKSTEPDQRDLHISLTGEPAFSSEIGRAMENDLKGGIAFALGLIALLFWWMQRRLKLLGGLVVTLTAIFAVALGMAGWIFGELSIVALASAEILIGLATDYGLVICQEGKLAGHDRRALFRASAKPVACGAITTAVVFSALHLGHSPGLAQLGSIVAIGLIAAAVLMVAWYLPFVARAGVNRPVPDGAGRWLPRRRVSLALTFGVLAICGAILAWKGMPGAEFDSRLMRPRDSAAMAGFERMTTKFPPVQKNAIPVVVEADSDAGMQARFSEATERMKRAQETGTIERFRLAGDWWPHADWQAANHPALASIVTNRERLFQEAEAAGFTAEGTALARAVLDFLGTWPKDRLLFPSSAAAQEVMGLTMRRKKEGGGYLHGWIVPAPAFAPGAENYARLRELNGGGIWLSGWDLLKPALAELIRGDLIRMFLPMTLVLVTMMAVVFRHARDVALAFAAMAVSTLALLAVMSACGWKWNFVNLMATPLLLGTGIDYAIHVTLTLKRTGGCFRELWNGTGKALLFCGASNVIGFGSLIGSSSDALSSLGIVAVAGVISSLATSLFLLPGWHSRG